jgi:hypothetical protein
MTLLVTLCSPRQISQIRASQAGIPTARRATVTQPAIPTLSHAASSLGKTLEMLVQRPDRYAPCAGDRCQRCFVAASPPVFLHPGPFLLDHKLQRQCNWPGRSGLLPSRRLAEDFMRALRGFGSRLCRISISISEFSHSLGQSETSTHLHVGGGFQRSGHRAPGGGGAVRRQSSTGLKAMGVSPDGGYAA